MRASRSTACISTCAPEGPWKAELIWRGWVVQCPAYHGASLAWADLEVAAGLPHQGEYGLALDEAMP